MSFFQNIQKFQNKLKNLFKPESKFEQEVLGEATTNLEKIENLEEIADLRTDVAEAVTEYDKYFPNEDNNWNNYELYDIDENLDYDIEKHEFINKNSTASRVVELEEQLQEQGKYIGMDEETRIKAVLAEGEAAGKASDLSSYLNYKGQSIDDDVLEAYKISFYQRSMDDEKAASTRGAETVFENGGILEGLNAPRMLVTLIKGGIYGMSNSLEDIQNYSNTEKYVSMILANDKATRQYDGSYSTKTSEEWAKIDEEKEKELRDMPSEELFAMGQELEEQLRNRYNELTADKENER